MISVNKKVTIYTLFFFIFSCVLLFGAIAPLLLKGTVLYLYLEIPLHFIYKSICHTIPEKCITIGDTKTLACSRCVGIYTSGVGLFGILSLLTFLSKNYLREKLFDSSIYYLLISFAPIHFVLLQLHLINYDKVTAFATGFISSLFFIHYIYVLYFQSIKD